MIQPARYQAVCARAFTLVELLAVMAVAALLMAGAFSVLNGLSGQWLLNAGVIQGRAEARLALERLRRDLEGAVRSAPETWLLLRPATMAAAGSPASTELYLLSTSQDRAAPVAGDVWAVGYAPSLADPFLAGGPDTRRGLYRLSVKPTDVFSTGIESTTGDWWKDFWEARRTTLDNPPNLLVAAAVIRCEATVEDRQTRVLQRVPTDRLLRAAASGVTIEPPLGTTTAANLRLAAIDITLIVLRPEGAARLRDRKTLTEQQWRQYGDSFSERIIF